MNALSAWRAFVDAWRYLRKFGAELAEHADDDSWWDMVLEKAKTASGKQENKELAKDLFTAALRELERSAKKQSCRKK